ncbi:MAG: glycosyltransferase family 39 protein [Candidatus Omnitrophota bacterium]
MELKQNSHFKNIFLLIILSYFFFFLGNSIFSLTNPDEVFYVQTAREMIDHNSWATPYLFDQPQFEKPVFLYWLLRIVFMFFGRTSFVARFIPALFATIGILAVYALVVLGLRNRKKAFISSLILMSSGIYIGLARTVFTDMVFSVFIVLSLLSFYWGYLRREYKALSMILFSISAGAAVLTKGPLGVVIPGLVVILFLVLRKDLKYLFSKYLVWAIAVFLLVSLPWYILMVKKYGQSFTQEFFYNDHLRRFLEAEHYNNDTWYFYPLSMVLGMFPWVLYVIAGLFYLVKKFADNEDSVYDLLLLWIGVVFLVFQPAHSKLVSYVFPCFPALAIIAGNFIYDADIYRGRLKKGALFAAMATSAAFIIMTAALIVFLFIPPKVIIEYIPTKQPLYVVSFLLLVITVVFFILNKRSKIIKSSYALMLVIPVMFTGVPFVQKNIEPYLSSKEICRYLSDNHLVNNKILCSKPFARGIRYYTDKQVAVMNTFGKQFFSAHPVPFLDDDHKVLEFFRGQKITYCVLKKSDISDIERIPGCVPAFGKEFNYKVLKKVGNEYVLKITPKKRLD